MPKLGWQIGCWEVRCLVARQEGAGYYRQAVGGGVGHALLELQVQAELPDALQQRGQVVGLIAKLGQQRGLVLAQHLQHGAGCLCPLGCCDGFVVGHLRRGNQRVKLLLRQS